MKKVQITFTTNPSTKKAAETIANKLGMSLSTVLNMCLNQMIYQHGLPFSTKLPNDSYNHTHVTTPKELKQIVKQFEHDFPNRKRPKSVKSNIKKRVAEK